MSRLANQKTTTRLAAGTLAAGSPRGKAGGRAMSASTRQQALFGHQDIKSFAIVAVVAIVAMLMVAAVWVMLERRSEPLAQPIVTTGQQSGDADLAAKVTHTYWQETHEIYHHYYTDPKTGRMIDGGRISVEEMMRQGIEVPGYVATNKAAASNNQDELALRFKSIRDHLN